MEGKLIGEIRSLLIEGKKYDSVISRDPDFNREEKSF
jgi:hypothetical protein